MQDFLKECLEKINLKLTQEKIEKLIKFMYLVIDENKRQNLTSITQEREFIIKHIIDSLTLYHILPDTIVKVIDIGSGAGFPSIPLRIVKEHAKFTIVDATKKKTDFISKAISDLDIQKNTNVLCMRAEDMAHSSEYRASFDIATARAVASLPVLIELSVPLLKKGGHYIAMKGKELENADNALQLTGAMIEKISNIVLPYSDYQRNLVIIKKIKNTPKLYPRRYSLIKRNIL
jgi:16S rRNA (guanine527-N7)-methyltransferase